jgi:peptide/nickel transport system ATP-binding protein
MNVLTISQLFVRYIGTEEHAVKNVSFSIKKGEIFALVGESGSGKSTVLQSILRILPAPGLITKGSITLKGQEILSLHPTQLRTLRWHSASMVFQSALAALHPTLPVHALFADTAAAHQVTLDHNKMRSLFSLVDLPIETAQRYPHELSGGQRQRIVIALALLLEPSLIIFDEPTTALDVLVERDILDKICSLQKKQGFSALIVTHDLPLILRYAHRVGIMKDGALIEIDTPQNLRNGAHHPYTKQLLQAEHDLKQIQAPREQKEVVLQLQNLHRYFGTFHAVQDLSITLHKGEAHALIGGSGCGKSTTAKMICGLLRPSEGKITLNNVPIRNIHPKIQMIFQDPFAALNPIHTVSHHLHRPLKTVGIRSKAERERQIENLLSQVELDPSFATRHPHELSGGQRQRVIIARALAAKPDVLIADEPTSMLDLSVRKGVLDLLSSLCAQGITLLMITHDIRAARYLCGTIHVMEKGKIVESSTSENITKQAKHPYTKRLIAATEES